MVSSEMHVDDRYPRYIHGNLHLPVPCVVSGYARDADDVGVVQAPGPAGLVEHEANASEPVNGWRWSW